MIRLFVQWLLSAVSLTLVARVMPDVHIKDFASALTVAAVYGLLHALLYNVLQWIFFVPRLLTLGLFSFAISAFLLFLTGQFVEGFQIKGIGTWLLAAVGLTILNSLWRALLF